MTHSLPAQTPPTPPSNSPPLKAGTPAPAAPPASTKPPSKPLLPAPPPGTTTPSARSRNNRADSLKSSTDGSSTLKYKSAAETALPSSIRSPHFPRARFPCESEALPPPTAPAASSPKATAPPPPPDTAKSPYQTRQLPLLDSPQSYAPPSHTRTPPRSPSRPHARTA